jgi:hypothetical protein
MCGFFKNVEIECVSVARGVVVKGKNELHITQFSSTRLDHSFEFITNFLFVCDCYVIREAGIA